MTLLYASLLNLPVILRFHLLNEMFCLQWEVQILHKRGVFMHDNVSCLWKSLSDQELKFQWFLSLVFCFLSVNSDKENISICFGYENISKQHWVFITEIDKSLCPSMLIFLIHILTLHHKLQLINIYWAPTIYPQTDYGGYSWSVAQHILCLFIRATKHSISHNFTFTS